MQLNIIKLNIDSSEVEIFTAVEKIINEKMVDRFEFALYIKGEDYITVLKIGEKYGETWTISNVQENTLTSGITVSFDVED